MDEKKQDLDVECEFGGVSIGDHSARLGVKIDRGSISLDVADAMFAGKVLQGTVTLGNRGDAQQQRLPGMEDEGPTQIESVMTAKRFGVTPKEIAVGLTFELTSISVQDLAGFAKRAGVLAVDCIGVVEDSSGGDDDDDEDRPRRRKSTKPLPGSRQIPGMELEQLRIELDPIGHESLAVLTSAKLKKLLKENYQDGLGITPKKAAAVASACGGDSLDKFEAWMSRSSQWYRDLSGFGEEWVTRLQDAHLALRLAFPIPSDESVLARREELYQEGVTASLDNKTEMDCPYPDVPGTETQSMIWTAGWRAMENERGTDEGTVFDGDDEDTVDAGELGGEEE